LLTFVSTMANVSAIITINSFFVHKSIYLKNYNLLERESFYYQPYFSIFFSNHLIFCLIRLILHFLTQLLVKFCNFARFLSKKEEQIVNKLLKKWIFLYFLTFFAWLSLIYGIIWTYKQWKTKEKTLWII